MGDFELKHYSKGCYVGTLKNQASFEHLIISETVYNNVAHSDWHYHENLHFCHVLNGGSVEKRKGSVERQLAGDFLFYNRGIVHRNLGYQESTRIFSVEVEESFFRQNNLNPAPVNISIYNKYSAQLLLLKILAEYYINDDLSQLSISHLCHELVGEDSFTSNSRSSPSWTKKLAELLNETWNTTITLDQISGHLNLHPVSISRSMTRYFNCTLGEYIRRIRISKCLPLIKSNKSSLTEIAYECGFSDQSHFTNTFKRLTGFLPKNYRKL